MQASMCISISLDDFLPSVAGGCSDANTFGSYKRLPMAEIECNLDQTCIGILDEGCDDIGDYRLCRYSFLNPSDSCIHKKKVNNGT